MTTSPRPGPLRRFLGGAWAALDFSRRLVFNLLFLLVLFLLLVGLLAGPSVKPLHEKSALVLDMEGRLVEQFTQQKSAHGAFL